LRVGIVSRTDRERALEISRNITEILKGKYEIFIMKLEVLIFTIINIQTKHGDD
jgi:hypothetical protein